MARAFTFDADSHIYTFKGQEIPGCTRVIDTGGMCSYEFVRPDILERTSLLGIETHRCTALYDKGTLDLDTVHRDVYPRLHGWMDFRRLTGFVPSMREHQLVAEARGFYYGMRLDAYGLTGRRLNIPTIVEIKTCSTIMPHHEIQTAGYALGLPRQAGGVEIRSALARFLGRRRIIVQLKPDGTCKIHECDKHEDAENFLALLRISYLRTRTREIYREAA